VRLLFFLVLSATFLAPFMLGEASKAKARSFAKERDPLSVMRSQTTPERPLSISDKKKIENASSTVWISSNLSVESECLLEKKVIQFKLSPKFHAENTYFLSIANKLSHNRDPVQIQKETQKWGFHQFRFLTSVKTGVDVYVTSNDSFVLVSFRGTQEPIDFIKNFNFIPQSGSNLGIPGQIHGGFSESFLSIWPQLQSSVKEFSNLKKPVVITGHSLGGAMATLAAVKLHQEGLKVSMVYTFGQPRIGDKEFAVYVDKILGNRYHRVVYHNDLVARIPPSRESVLQFSKSLPSFLSSYFVTSAFDARYSHAGRFVFINESQKVIHLRKNETYDETDSEYWKDFNKGIQTGDLSSRVQSGINPIQNHMPFFYVCVMRSLVE
jgi:triacylglycerol lipase